MALPSVDMLKGALAAHNQRTDGTHDELHARLGAFLVAKLLSGDPLPSTTSASAGKRPVASEPGAETKPKRRKSNWHAFVQTESKKVREGRPDLRGHDVLKECSRRWKIMCANKASGSSPPLLTNGSDDGSDDASSDSAAEGLTNALMEIPPAEVNQGLTDAGLAVHDDPAANARSLAFQMLDIDEM